MESIKEEELNLQREVVTTTPNTWLVEAVNPTTGEKKMINVSNFASVVAGVLNISFINSGILILSQGESAELPIILGFFQLKSEVTGAVFIGIADFDGITAIRNKNENIYGSSYTIIKESALDYVKITNVSAGEKRLLWNCLGFKSL